MTALVEKTGEILVRVLGGTKSLSSSRMFLMIESTRSAASGCFSVKRMACCVLKRLFCCGSSTAKITAIQG